MGKTSGPEALRQWIERRELQQQEAAKLIGIHFTLLNHYLTRRRRPPLESAIKIERVTGIPVEAWVTSEQDEPALVVAATRRNRR